jgi:tetratricopeptide (TPR) repeat protein
MTTTGDTRSLDPDTLAALEEQRDFLLRSLEDLEREHDAGDVDQHDYATLKDDYTARAARTIRAIESHRARLGAGRPRRSWPRLVGTVAGVVALAVLAGVVVAQFAGRREAGDALTGDIRESTRTQLDSAVARAAQGDYDGAIEIYDRVLAGQPGNVEALAFKGWFQFLAGDQAGGIVTLIEAAETDPDYPPTHAFLAVAFARLGRPETALAELDRLDALDPPPDVARLVEGLREELERAVADAPAG